MTLKKHTSFDMAAWKTLTAISWVVAISAYTPYIKNKLTMNEMEIKCESSLKQSNSMIEYYENKIKDDESMIDQLVHNNGGS